MAWTTPRTWVTGELVTASLLNTHLKDNLNALRQRGPWTVTDASGAGLTFTGVSGRYYKTDLGTICWFELVFPNNSDGSAARFGGLPFTVASEPTNGCGGFVYYTDADLGGAAIYFTFIVQGTSIFPYKPDGSQPTNANLSLKSVRGCLIFEATQ